MATGFETDTVDVTVDPGTYRRFVTGETRVHFEGDGVDAWVTWRSDIHLNAAYRFTIERVES